MTHIVVSMPNERDNVAQLEGLMREHGLTQNDFANVIGVTPQTVNRWLKSRTLISDRKLKRVQRDVALWAARQLDDSVRTLHPLLPQRHRDEPLSDDVPTALAQIYARLDEILDILDHKR